MTVPPPAFRPIALRVLNERYLRRNPDGHVIETPDGLFRQVRSLSGLPEHIRRLFPTTFEVSVENQVKMQAAFQRHVENAVSKTINLAPSATAADVAAAFRLAHASGLKGITVYRYGSKPGQVLSLPSGTEALTLSHEFSEECRLCSV
jgi:ribonucleotide reductase alpha subunit